MAAVAGLPAGQAVAFQAEGELASYEIALPVLEGEAGFSTPEAAEAAWQDFARQTEGVWSAVWNQATETPERMLGRGPALVSPGMTSELVERVSRDFLRENRSLFRVDTDDLTPLSVRQGRGVWFVTFGQLHDGLVVEGARLDLRYGVTGNLLLAGGVIHPNIDIQTTPGMSGDEAVGFAVRDLPSDWRPALEGTPELRVLPLARGSSYEYRLIYSFVFDVSSPRSRWQTSVDANTGEILHRTNLVRYAELTGTVNGDIQEMEPTGPYVELGHPHNRISFEGLGAFYTDEDGSFSVTAPNEDPRMATVGINGRWLNSNRQDGPDAEIAVMATPGVPLDVKFDDGNSHPAERDVYYHGTLAHDYMKNIDSGLTALDYEMSGNVNISQTCNAYWDGSSINFFQEGGGCANTGQIADVIYHEYGHGVTQFTYAPLAPNGAMHEGFSDYLANTITDQPLVGIGFYGPGSHLRNSDNDRTWPAPECGGQVHCVGEVIAGALWHMRENLIDELGDHDAGVELADDLWHFAKYGINNTFESYYFDLLAVDDDNGTLVDGTPHGISIVQAFDRHNIGPGFILEILHDPLADTEDSTSSHPVVATFSSFVPVLEESLAVYYSTSTGFTESWTRLPMTPTGEIREYMAEIPPQPYTTTVRYYISGATSMFDLTAVLPEGAPGDAFEFIVGVDATPPTIVHVPIGNRSAYVWPVEVTADVTDNQALAEVVLEYKINGEDQTPVTLTQDDDSDTYRGLFGGSVSVGDLVEYRIRATDAAESPNTAFDPAIGFHQFEIELEMKMNAENGSEGWTHDVVTQGYTDQWHISTERNFTLGGQYSWKFGDTGNGPYADLADGALITPAITLGVDAVLTFYDWIDAEVQNASQAWDGAVVELTTDGGATWDLIEPVGGYPYTIVNNPASPFPGGYPCFSGSHDWEQQTFELAAFQGETIQIRFRFGSDGYVTEEGWHVDDIVLIPDQGSSDVSFEGGRPLVTGLEGARPNPFNPLTTIRFTVAEPRERLELSVFDISGRLVRRLMEGAAEAGAYSVIWDGRNDAGHEVPSGLYFATMKTHGVKESAKLLLVK
jgi:hypothetical protein